MQEFSDVPNAPCVFYGSILETILESPNTSFAGSPDRESSLGASSGSTRLSNDHNEAEVEGSTVGVSWNGSHGSDMASVASCDENAELSYTSDVSFVHVPEEESHYGDNGCGESCSSPLLTGSSGLSQSDLARATPAQETFQTAPVAVDQSSPSPPQTTCTVAPLSSALTSDSVSWMRQILCVAAAGGQGQKELELDFSRAIAEATSAAMRESVRPIPLSSSPIAHQLAASAHHEPMDRVAEHSEKCLRLDCARLQAETDSLRGALSSTETDVAALRANVALLHNNLNKVQLDAQAEITRVTEQAVSRENRLSVELAEYQGKCAALEGELSLARAQLQSAKHDAALSADTATSKDVAATTPSPLEGEVGSANNSRLRSVLEEAECGRLSSLAALHASRFELATARAEASKEQAAAKARMWHLESDAALAHKLHARAQSTVSELEQALRDALDQAASARTSAQQRELEAFDKATDRIREERARTRAVARSAQDQMECLSSSASERAARRTHELDTHRALLADAAAAAATKCARGLMSDAQRLAKAVVAKQNLSVAAREAINVAKTAVGDAITPPPHDRRGSRTSRGHASRDSASAMIANGQPQPPMPTYVSDMCTQTIETATSPSKENTNKIIEACRARVERMDAELIALKANAEARVERVEKRASEQVDAAEAMASHARKDANHAMARVVEISSERDAVMDRVAVLTAELSIARQARVDLNGGNGGEQSRVTQGNVDLEESIGHDTSVDMGSSMDGASVNQTVSSHGSLNKATAGVMAGNAMLELEAARGEIERMVAQVNDLDAKSKLEQQDASTAKTVLAQQLEELSASNARLTLQVATYAHVVDSLKVQLSDVRASLEKSEHDVKAAKADAGATMRRATELHAEVTTLTNANARLTEYASEVEQQLASKPSSSFSNVPNKPSRMPDANIISAFKQRIKELEAELESANSARETIRKAVQYGMSAGQQQEQQTSSASNSPSSSPNGSTAAAALQCHAMAKTKAEKVGSHVEVAGPCRCWECTPPAQLTTTTTATPQTRALSPMASAQTDAIADIEAPLPSIRGGSVTTNDSSVTVTPGEPSNAAAKVATPNDVDVLAVDLLAETPPTVPAPARTSNTRVDIVSEFGSIELVTKNANLATPHSPVEFIDVDLGEAAQGVQCNSKDRSWMLDRLQRSCNEAQQSWKDVEESVDERANPGATATAKASATLSSSLASTSKSKQYGEHTSVSSRGKGVSTKGRFDNLFGLEPHEYELGATM